MAIKRTAQNRRKERDTVKKIFVMTLYLKKTMLLKMGQEIFLANAKAKNKSSFMDMLQETLAENKIFSCQADADPNRLIIEIAINLQSENIVVVFKDIILLITLIDSLMLTMQSKALSC